jgi:hypothetical protein
MAKKKAPTDGGADQNQETAHSQQMEEIAKAQRESREAAADDDTPPEVIPDDDTPPVEDPADPDLESADDLPADPPADPPAPEMVTIKVDGIEVQVEKSKVYEAGQKALQKESAADRRLQEATDLLKKAQEQAAQNQQLAQPDEDDLSLSDEEIESIASEIAYGDDTQRASAVKRLVKTVQGAKATKGENLTPAEVTAAVRTELDRANFESALESFKKPQSEGGYGDLFDGGILENALAFEDKRLSELPEGKQMPYGDRLKKAGDTIRGKFQRPTTSSPNNDSRNAQRKAALGDAPNAAGGDNTPAPADRKPESESQRQARLIAETNSSRRPGR